MRTQLGETTGTTMLARRLNSIPKAKSCGAYAVWGKMQDPRQSARRDYFGQARSCHAAGCALTCR